MTVKRQFRTIKFAILAALSDRSDFPNWEYLKSLLDVDVLGRPHANRTKVLFRDVLYSTVEHSVCLRRTHLHRSHRVYVYLHHHFIPTAFLNTCVKAHTSWYELYNGTGATLITPGFL